MVTGGTASANVLLLLLVAYGNEAAIILLGHDCATDAVPLHHDTGTNFTDFKTDDRLSQPHLMFIKWPAGLEPSDPKPATPTTKQTPGLQLGY